MSIVLRAEKSPWAHVVEFVLMEIDGDLVRAVSEPVVMRKVEPCEAVTHRPMVTLRGPEAQLLMDDLWRAGIRPSEGTGSAGQLAAVQSHLQHMRHVHDRLLDVVVDIAARNGARGQP